MKSIKGSQTEKNLLASFAGESQARNRYTFFSKVAEKEGYLQIANLFLETAENEKQHAKSFFKFLEGGMVEIQVSYPAGVIGTTIQNLEAAAAGENEEWTKLYKEAGDVAKAEGFDEVGNQFYQIAKVEKEHEARYRKLLASVKNQTVFKRNKPVRWKCLKCGYIHEGTEAPSCCPACAHPKKFYEAASENY